MLALYIVAGIVLLFLFLLCVPVRTVLTIDTDEVQKVKIRIHWLFGLIKITVNKTESTGTRPSEKPAKSTRTKRKNAGKSSPFSFFDSIGLIRRIGKLVNDIRSTIRTGTFQGAFTIGFEDPADTGVFFSFVGPVNMFLNMLPKYDVTLVPSFDDGEIIEGSLRGNVTVYPIAVLFPVMKFGASRDVLRFAGKQISGRWKR